MQLYLDTGHIDEIRKAAAIGIIDGVTTNPSLIAREHRDFTEVLSDIIAILGKVTQDFTVSAEVTADTSNDMLAQGRALSAIDPHIIIKVPMTQEGMRATRLLTGEGIRVNVTLVFSATQALLAAKAGAWCVSPFMGRLDDAGHSGERVIQDIRSIYDRYGYDTRILAASARHPTHMKQAALAGADIITIPWRVYEKAFVHPLTDAGLDAFMQDWKRYEETR